VTCTKYTFWAFAAKVRHVFKLLKQFDFHSNRHFRVN